MTTVAAGLGVIDRLAKSDDEAVRIAMPQASSDMAIFGYEGRVVRANEALRHMIARGALPPGLTVRSLLNPDGQQADWEAICPVLSGAPPLQTFTTTLTEIVQGTERTVDISAMALREADGIISGVILHVCDVTERVGLEAQLAQSQRLQAVGQFTSGIAHDFSNLLMAMTGAAEALLSRGGLDLEAQSDLQEIRAGGERGVDLVRQLLAFITHRPRQQKVLAINELVSGLLRLLSRLLGPSIEFTLMLHDGDLAVQGDPTPLDQVLVNLVVNARNAMPDGGTVTIRTAALLLETDTVVDGRSISAGHYVTIEVQDTGVGIPPDVLPRIFDPFFTTRCDQGGTGLGLSTVDAIIRRFGGVLTVRSEVGAGTVFRVYLPRQQDVRSGMPLAVAAASGLLRRRPMTTPCQAETRAVLLVDDEEGLRLLLARALAGSGWHVLCAESGEAALALLHDDRTGLANLCAVVTDVDLPDVQGSALIQAVRQLRPGVPAVLISGHLERRVRDALDVNTVFLSKPCSLKAVVAVVEEQAWTLHDLTSD